MKIQSKKAFTLIELIVVIIIITILGTISYISIQGYSSQARDTKRISDIQNIKKSLELININSGSYPLPDNQGTVSYSGELLWTQGTIGDNVFRILSKSLEKKPIDPLYKFEYIYSTINTQNEYQIMGVFEANLLNNNLFNKLYTYAIGDSYIRIEGKFNKIFVKSNNYIIPTPSIINAEPLNIELQSNYLSPLKSGIIDAGKNLLNLSVNDLATITGSLNIYPIASNKIFLTSSSFEKAQVITNLQNTYFGSIFETQDLYKSLFLVNSDEEKAKLADQIILNRIY